MNTISMFPQSRSHQLVVKEIPGELLVYDLNTNKAMCLNDTSAFVWNHCDGKTDIEQIKALFEQKNKVKVDSEIIFTALDGLKKAELLENYSPRNQDQITRRNALLRIGLPVAMLPLVSILVAPRAVQAASAVCAGNPADSCTTASDCPPAVCDPECSCQAVCNSNCCGMDIAC